MEHLMNATEVSAMLGIKKGTLYQLIHYGRIPCVKLSSRCVRFSEREIVNWLQSLSHTPALATTAQPEVKAPRKAKAGAVKSKSKAANGRVDAIIAQAKKEVLNN